MTKTDDLIVRHIPLAKSVAAKFNLPFIYDDLVGEGMLALVKCAEKFDSSRGTTFGQFAKVSIKNAMIKYVKRFNKDAMTKSLDSYNEDGVPYLSIAGKDGQVNQISLLDALSYHLHPVEEWVVLKKYFNNESFDNIASELGFELSRVKQIHSNAIKKLKNVMITGDETAPLREEDSSHLLQVVQKMFWDEWGLEIYEL